MVKLEEKEQRNMGNWIIQFLWLVIALGLVASLFTIGQREMILERSKEVEMALDYDLFVRVASENGMDSSEALEEFKEAGITTLFIKEPTLARLEERGLVDIRSGEELLEDLMLAGEVLDFEVSGQSLYVQGYADGLTDWLYEAFLKRMEPERVDLVSIGDLKLLVLLPDPGSLPPGYVQPKTTGYKGPYNKQVMERNLGLNIWDLELTDSLDFYRVVQLENYSDVSLEDIENIFAELGKYEIETIYFGQNEVLGYPDHIEEVGKLVKEGNYRVTYVENLSPIGMQALAKEIDYEVIRGHAMFPGQSSSSIRLAAKDRSIGLFINSSFSSLQGRSGFTPDTVREMRKGLQSAGYDFGKAEAFREYEPVRWMNLLTGAGLLAGFALLFLLIWRSFFGSRLVWLSLLGWLAGVSLLVYGLSPFRDIVAFLGAVSFPVLGIYSASRVFPRLRIRASLAAIVSLVVGSMVTLMGALLLNGYLGSVDYVLGFEQFVGIRLALVVPVLLTGLLVSSSYSFLPDAKSIKRLWNHRISIGQLSVVLLFAIAALVMVQRSGNLSLIPVGDLELQIRHFLEDTLAARPRTKEFLLGHPALIMGLLFGLQGWKHLESLFLVVAAIGQASLMNTFMHTHTPLGISLLRTFNGVWLGILLGLVAGWILVWIFKRIVILYEQQG